MTNKIKGVQFTGWQQFFLVLLRLAIGWHFIREGWIKWIDPNWTAQGYLLGSWGPLSDIFHWMASQGWVMMIINFTMPWLLIIAGAGLILGLFTRTCCALAMIALAMFYATTPPFEFAPPSDWTLFFTSVQHATWAGNKAIGAEGNYWLVNKNLIEFLALAALWACDTGRFAGLDIFLRPAEESQRIRVVAPQKSQSKQPAQPAEA